ncbi:MAG TPA: hypothetical protein VE934_16925 [Polaromonas sp.]|uniref:hypothetical protein n=1 Tax=Polaromonas sp. TaxID=1869339 RepID=UPI002D677300|nr:hypothetical protein [Polaromonas sp.]HYW58635.1 hypothetical protein [Polaromonas sp.]
MKSSLHRRARPAGFALMWIIALAMSGCATVAPRDSSTTALYEAAIADAAVASPRKVSPLMPLPAGDKVRVVSWVTENRMPCKPPESACPTTTPPAPIWVTLAGEVRARCSAWGLRGNALRQRLEQLLGLPLDPPPQFRKARFVTMEVARERLDRPCLGIDETNPQSPVCTVGIQANSAPDVRDYVLRQMADSFVVGGPAGPGYPFTRLGYTYDWNPVNARPNHYGASEFLVQANTPATVIAQQDTDDYCAAP